VDGSARMVTSLAQPESAQAGARVGY
jgi:hypothetical protein